MARDEGAGAGSVLLAFLLGAVTGAAVALLYAPAPGRETREFLGEKAREGRDRAGDAAIKGILDSAQGDYLYFLTKPGGKSEFSATPLTGQ